MMEFGFDFFLKLDFKTLIETVHDYVWTGEDPE